MERTNFVVEQHSIDYIPAHLRHGKVSSLFFIWFTADMELPVVAAGAAAGIHKLGLVWAIVAILVGALGGAVLMAYHSAQGPHLGLPQMIQSRAQFGYYGASMPLVLVVLIYLGFYAAGAVLGAQVLSRITPLPVGWSIVVMGVASTLLTTFGYNIIHWFMRYLSYFVGAVFIVLTLLLLFGPHGQHMTSHGGGFHTGAFLLAVSVAAMTQLGYAPYVADYSRYLPESTSIARSFWWTYFGVSLSGVWLLIFGALLSYTMPKLGVVGGITQISFGYAAWFGYLCYLALMLGVIGINGLNLYGAYMSSLSCLSAFFPRWRKNFWLRMKFIVPVAVLATGMSFLYEANLLASFEEFLTIALAFLIPWTAVNLVDFYLVRYGRYSVTDILRPSGRYGNVSVPGFVAYLAGFVVQIPFMSNDVYQGPIASLLGGGDVSWVIGALVGGAVYLAAMWSKRGAGEGAAVGPVPAVGEGD